MSELTDNLGLGNLTMADLLTMTETQESAAITEAIRQQITLLEADEDELAEFKEGIIENAELSYNEIRELMRELRRGLRHANPDQATRGRVLLGELQNLLDELKDFKHDFTDYFIEELHAHRDRHRQALTGEPVNVANFEMGAVIDLYIENNTYTYTLVPQAANPFGDATMALSDYEWLLDQGIINEQGEVIRNNDADTRLNFHDVETALKERYRDPTRQTVFITLEPGQQITMMEYSAAGTLTVKIEDAEGHYSFHVFENAQTAIFELIMTGHGINRGLLEALPPELQKRLFLRGVDGSVYETILGERAYLEALSPPPIIARTEIANPRLGAIRGYAGTISALGIEPGSAFADRALENDETRIAKQILDALFTHYDSVDPAADSRALWDSIQEILGVVETDESKSVTMQHVFYAVTVAAPHLLQPLFGALLQRLEGLFGQEPSKGEMTILMIMSEQQTLDPEFWNLHFPSGTTTGTNQGSDWSKNPGVGEALENFQTISTDYLDGTLPFRFNEILSDIGETTRPGDPSPSAPGGDEITFRDEMNGVWVRIGFQDPNDRFTDIPNGQWELFYAELLTQLFDESGQLKETLGWSDIVNAANTIYPSDSTMRDLLLSSFLFVVYDANNSNDGGVSPEMRTLLNQITSRIWSDAKTYFEQPPALYAGFAHIALYVTYQYYYRDVFGQEYSEDIYQFMGTSYFTNLNS